MEYRQLGHSGLRVPVLSLGTGTFGGTNAFFKTWGETDVKEASRLIDISLDNGLNFFDTANVYSGGDAERILGAALEGRRDKAIIATKSTFTTGPDVNDSGSSRFHILREVESSLKKLKTDYLDLYIMHGFDSRTPLHETLSTLDQLVKSGKVRYIGASNFTGWQLMKSLSVSEKLGLEKYVIHQAYYSLIGRDFEWDLMPVGQDQQIGTMVWSPLGWGRLTGKIRRGQPLPEGRIKSGGAAGGPEIDNELLYNVVDVLTEISKETNKTVSQIALNWLLQRPTVSNIVIGARNEDQLRENLGAVDWKLSVEQIERLEKVSAQTPRYPYWVGAR
ncbi:aldo/keto reductase [Pseudochryseolinea flava]|uniref:Aldo/keto reductase n=1 Tax=Pseudochryseolinea flava TaxID=2059302 RepID=A0A364Y7F8_9BACT|nr:aldo/keto reductase [Pseudochryseolinea flava]RAW02880.1 aldo/keto reductase [Pseudochryseolinea flava]